MSRRSLIAFRILTPLVTLLLVEGVAHLFDVWGLLSLAERRSVAAYRNVPWADQYLRDFRECAAQTRRAHQPRYARYILQDINENCTTPTVNYGNRIRRTWNPPAETTRFASTVYEVAMFGGSTMEGQGTIDDETIPSHFSKLANASSAPAVYHVTNFGVGGYTFTQSVFKLLTLLREGRHFDYVMFYDGANDIDYAYENGEVGGLADEQTVRVRLEGSTWQKLKLAGQEAINGCVLCFAGVMVVRHTPVLKDYVTPLLVKLRDAIHFKKGQAAGDDVAAVAASIATYYAQSHALLAAVCDAYHVPCMTFWQPSLMYDRTYAPGEATLTNQDPRLTDAKLRELYARTRDEIRKLPLPRFVDMSDALEGRTTACYVDAVHLSGACNGIVARRMYELFRGNQP
jgi:hypothetical protein